MPDERAWPSISIVTPSFNQGSYLEETIRSVLLQGYRNLEYIIMDGGSTDESIDIIRKYEPWLFYWVSEPDAGQTAAINSGWRISTGDAITWLNSDDILLPCALANSVGELFAEHPVDLVYGDIQLIDAHSRPTRLVRNRRFSHEHIILRARNVVGQQGFLMKRTLLSSVGWLDESMHFCMDFDYWTRLALHGCSATHVDCLLAGFREHSTTKSSTLHKTRIEDRFRIFEKAFSSPLLPESYLARRAEARNHLTAAAAYIAYKAHDPVLTRTYARMHVRSARFSSSRLCIILLCASWFGQFGLNLVRNMFKLLLRAGLTSVARSENPE
ncbi:MAG: glycosyltransferase family 2 protein [Anaerolineae bacterium]